MNDTPDHVARLCVVLPVLTRAAHDAGSGRDLDTVLRRARAGRDIGPAFTALCRRLGVPYGAPVRTWPWAGQPGHTAGEVFVCPTDRCSRAWIREPGVPLPTCHLERAPLRRVPEPPVS